MTYSEIEITFNEDLVDEAISFNSGDVPSGDFTSIIESWVELRSQPLKVTKGIATATLGERSAINFVDSFELDFNEIKTYTVQRVLNVVTIKGNSAFYRFDSELISANPSKVSFSITNFTDIPFEISSITFAQAGSNFCSNVEISILTAGVADSFNIGGYEHENTGGANPYITTIGRGNTITISATKGLQTVSELVARPEFLSASNVIPSITSLPGGSNLVIVVIGNGTLTWNFSLDGITYQISPVFVGLVSGNYTAYVRDQYGCIVEKEFVVDGLGNNSPFFSISKSNSIRFKNLINWGDSANYKNDENTLSNEVDVPLPKREIQLFQSGDIITTQFKSNYPNNIANVHIVDDLPGDIITAVTVEKLTENIGRTDSRDAFKFDLEDGSLRTGIFFTAGNIYDYQTGTDTGEDHALNGTVPEWGVAGNYVKISSNWYLIEDVLFIESLAVEALIITETTVPTPGPPQAIIVSSIFNRQNYEVFEFTVDMADYLDKCIQVRFENSSVVWGDLNHYSEVIKVKTRHEGTIEINYWNEHNTDIFYETGIRNKIRVQLEKIEGKMSDESDTYKTDTTAQLLSTQIHELDLFEFMPVTKEIMRKIIQALSHSEVYLDGVKYVKESIDDPELLGETNRYIVKATMIKAKNVYNSDSGALEFNQGSIEIPSLVGGGNDFVKYK